MSCIVELTHQDGSRSAINPDVVELIVQNKDGHAVIYFKNSTVPHHTTTPYEDVVEAWVDALTGIKTVQPEEDDDDQV